MRSRKVLIDFHDRIRQPTQRLTASPLRGLNAFQAQLRESIRAFLVGAWRDYFWMEASNSDTSVLPCLRPTILCTGSPFAILDAQKPHVFLDGALLMSRPKTPLIAADILIRLSDQPDKVVLIERLNPPHGLAVPGGFVDVGERVETAAVREAKEEVSLEVELELLLGIYSDPARDPRGHTVTAVYVATAHGQPQAADDAKAIVLADPQDAELKLVFDHRLVLDDYVHWLQSGELPPLRF